MAFLRCMVMDKEDIIVMIILGLIALLMICLGGCSAVDIGGREIAQRAEQKADQALKMANEQKVEIDGIGNTVTQLSETNTTFITDQKSMQSEYELAMDAKFETFEGTYIGKQTKNAVWPYVVIIIAMFIFIWCVFDRSFPFIGRQKRKSP